MADAKHAERGLILCVAERGELGGCFAGRDSNFRGNCRRTFACEVSPC